MADLGTNIKIARIRQGLSQLDLAIQANVSKQAISHYESNNRVPGTATLRKIAEALGTSLDELTGLTGEQRANVDRVVDAIANGVLRTPDEAEAALANPDLIPVAPYAGGMATTVPAIRVVGNVQVNDAGVIRLGDYRGWATADVNDPSAYFYWQCTRDAMTPNVQPGDLLLVHIQDDVDDGDMAIVVRPDIGGRLCRVRKEEDGAIRMTFDKAGEKDVVLRAPGEGVIAGKVKRLVRAYE